MYLDAGIIVDDMEDLAHIASQVEEVQEGPFAPYEEVEAGETVEAELLEGDVDADADAEAEAEEEVEASEDEVPEPEDFDILDTKTHALSNDKGQLYLTTYIKNGTKMVRIETDKSITMPISMLSTYVMRNDIVTFENKFVDNEDFLCIVATMMFVVIVGMCGLCVWVLSISDRQEALHYMHRSF